MLARRDVVEEYERVCAEAGVYAGLVDLATFSALNLVLASPNAARRRLARRAHAARYTSIAIVRGEDVIFFRNRPEGDDESLTDLVHQTAMYYQDRLAGQGFARVLLGGSGRVPGAVDWRGGASKSGSARRGADRSDGVAAPADRIARRRTCSTCSRRWRACCCARGGRRWASDAAHQPLDPPLLQRPRRAGGARRGRGRRARRSRCSTSCRSCGWPLSQQTLGASAAEAEQEAARLRAEAARIRAQINPQELQVVANAAREANAHHRPARVLVDRAVRAVRGDAAARRPDHRGAAAARREQLRRRRRRRGAASRGSRRVHRGARNGRARSTTCSRSRNRPATTG